MNPGTAHAPSETFPVVCIGLSSGAIEPVKRIFRDLSPSTGMAFVVIHHLRRQFPSHLAEILSNCTEMRVETVRPGRTVQPNHVYVLASGDEMAITDNTFHAQPRTKIHGWSNVISLFLNSLLASAHPGVAVILSGMDENGAAALKAFKQRGGITIAQVPASAVHSDMPAAAIATGSIDYVLQPENIAKRLERIARAGSGKPGGGQDHGRS